MSKTDAPPSPENIPHSRPSVGEVKRPSRHAAYIHTYIHTYVHTYTYIHTYIHTYRHAEHKEVSKDAKKRVCREMRLLLTKPHPEVDVYPCTSDMMFWKIVFAGPVGTPYEGMISPFFGLTL